MLETPDPRSRDEIAFPLNEFKPIVLTLLGIDLVIVAIAFSTIQAMWDMKNVFPRLMLVGILMVTPNSWEVFSLRNLIEYFINK